MASTIQLKTGTGSAVPSSLTQGEVAINIDNGLIYYGSGSGNNVKQLEEFTHITASGNISASGTGTNYIGGVEIDGGRVRVTDRVEHLGDDNTFIAFNTDELVLRTGGTDRYTVNSNGHRFTGNITASGNISSSGVITSTLEGNGATTAFVVDGYISASGYISTETDITASGTITAEQLTSTDDITAAGTVQAEHLYSTDDAQIDDNLTVGGDIIVADNILHSGNINTAIAFSTDVVTVKAENRSNFIVNNSGSLRTFHSSSALDANANGDIVYLGGTTSMDAGKIYHFKSDGTWELANSNAAATSDGLLAVALGAASDTNGMLLRGMVTLDHDPGAVGDVLYLDASNNGQASATVPSGDEDIVRVIGYCLNASTGQIWFNPSSTFVEVNT